MSRGRAPTSDAGASAAGSRSSRLPLQAPAGDTLVAGQPPRPPQRGAPAGEGHARASSATERGGSSDRTPRSRHAGDGQESKRVSRGPGGPAAQRPGPAPRGERLSADSPARREGHGRLATSRRASIPRRAAALPAVRGRGRRRGLGKAGHRGRHSRARARCVRVAARVRRRRRVLLGGSNDPSGGNEQLWGCASGVEEPDLNRHRKVGGVRSPVGAHDLRAVRGGGRGDQRVIERAAAHPGIDGTLQGFA